MVDLNKPNTVALVIEAVTNGSVIDWGLGKLLYYHAENAPLPTGRADLLLLDNDGFALHVVEVVAGKASAEDIGRLLGHCGWLNTMLVDRRGSTEVIKGADGPYPNVFPHVTEVTGIVLAPDFDPGALFALAASPDLVGRTYRFSIELSDLVEHRWHSTSTKHHGTDGIVQENAHPSPENILLEARAALHRSSADI